MTFARVDNGTMVYPFRVPDVLRLPAGDVDLRGKDPVILAAHGITEVATVARPADTSTTTHDRTVELVAGIPTEVWTARDKTVAEVAAEADRADRDTERAAVPADFAAVKAVRDSNQQDRSDMDPAAGLQKWTRDITFLGTGGTVRAEQRSDHLAAEVRKLKGDVRQLSAIIVRMIRAQHLDS